MIFSVSGMPVNRPNHADMCVLMGLEMIKTIKWVFFENLLKKYDVFFEECFNDDFYNSFPILVHQLLFYFSINLIN